MPSTAYIQEPELKSHLIGELAKGKSTTELANEWNIPKNSIANLKRVHRARITEIATRLMDMSAAAVIVNHVKTIELAGNVLNSKTPEGQPDFKKITKYSKLLEIADKKEYRTLLMMGIVPGGAPGPIIQQIIGEVNLNLVDPGVRQLLGGQLEQLEGVQDAEIVELDTLSGRELE